MTRVRFGIAAFVLLTTAGAVAAAPAVVALSPQPGVTLKIPKGWKACDAANDAKLGTAADPMGLQGQICGPHQANPDFKFGAFAPKPGQSLTVLFYVSDVAEPPVTGLDAKALAALTAQRKAKSERDIGEMGATLNAFSIRKDRLCGQPALVTTVTLTPAAGAATQVTTEKWEVPLNGHSYEFSFVRPKVFDKANKPIVAAIRASIKIAP